MRISDWSSDVCSSDLGQKFGHTVLLRGLLHRETTIIQAHTRAPDQFEQTKTQVNLPAGIFPIFVNREKEGMPGQSFGHRIDELGSTFHGQSRHVHATQQIARLEDRKSTRLNSSH